MIRFFTIITQKGITNRDHIYAIFNAFGAQIIKKRYYEKVPHELINKIENSVRNFRNEGDKFTEKNRQKLFVGKKIEVGVWEIKKTFWRKLKTHILSSTHINYILEADDSSQCAFTMTETEVAEIGGVFFWQTCYDATKFESANERLFEYDYLPLQLAKDGNGIFFEERIKNRLLDIGLINENDEVVLMIDNGGWEDLESLTASMDFVIQRKRATITETLLATALVTMPPLKPENVSEVIQQRKCILDQLGIQTSVLEVNKAIIYERSLPYNIIEYLASPKNRNIKKIVTEVASIAAILDAKRFKEVDVEFEVDGFNGISDYVEIDSNTLINDIFHFDFLDVLKTDGNSVFWTNLDHSLLNYQSCTSQLSKILNICHRSLHVHAIKTYNNIKQKYLNDNWLSPQIC